jgi:hypothetical protein
MKGKVMSDKNTAASAGKQSKSDHKTVKKGRTLTTGGPDLDNLLKNITTGIDSARDAYKEDRNKEQLKKALADLTTNFSEGIPTAWEKENHDLLRKNRVYTAIKDLLGKYVPGVSKKPQLILDEDHKKKYFSAGTVDEAVTGAVHLGAGAAGGEIDTLVSVSPQQPEVLNRVAEGATLQETFKEDLNRGRTYKSIRSLMDNIGNMKPAEIIGMSENTKELQRELNGMVGIVDQKQINRLRECIHLLININQFASDQTKYRQHIKDKITDLKKIVVIVNSHQNSRRTSEADEEEIFQKSQSRTEDESIEGSAAAEEKIKEGGNGANDLSRVVELQYEEVRQNTSDTHEKQEGENEQGKGEDSVTHKEETPNDNPFVGNQNRQGTDEERRSATPVGSESDSYLLENSQRTNEADEKINQNANNRGPNLPHSADFTEYNTSDENDSLKKETPNDNPFVGNQNRQGTDEERRSATPVGSESDSYLLENSQRTNEADEKINQNANNRGPNLPHSADFTEYNTSDENDSLKKETPNYNPSVGDQNGQGTDEGRSSATPAGKDTSNKDNKDNEDSNRSFGSNHNNQGDGEAPPSATPAENKRGSNLIEEENPHSHQGNDENELINNHSQGEKDKYLKCMQKAIEALSNKDSFLKSTHKYKMEQLSILRDRYDREPNSNNLQMFIMRAAIPRSSGWKASFGKTSSMKAFEGEAQKRNLMSSDNLITSLLNQCKEFLAAGAMDDAMDERMTRLRGEIERSKSKGFFGGLNSSEETYRLEEELANHLAFKVVRKEGELNTSGATSDDDYDYVRSSSFSSSGYE